MPNIEGNKVPYTPVREKQFLNEVIIIRLALIFCLIMFHSFCPYSNCWTPLSSEFMEPYYWISLFSNSFFLGSFVFISGYLYAYADLMKGAQPIGTVLKKKGMRLIVPSIVFSVLYLAIFGLKSGESWTQAFYTIIAGRGHMWFLPMLFWLFLGMELIKRIKLKPWSIFLITFLLTIGVFLPLPFRLNFACHYLIFFYMGYLAKSAVDFKFRGGNALVASCIVWLVMFVTVEWLTLHRPPLSPMVSKILTISLFYGKVIYVIAGTIFMYALALWLINKCKVKISNQLVKVSGLCFGIYLYQQFILIYLYYDTTFVDYVGVWAAPWLGFLITLVLSTVLSYLTVQTRLGKALIG